jgi:hypothetical protein
MARAARKGSRTPAELVAWVRAQGWGELLEVPVPSLLAELSSAGMHLTVRGLALSGVYQAGSDVTLERWLLEVVPAQRRPRKRAMGEIVRAVEVYVERLVEVLGPGPGPGVGAAQGAAAPVGGAAAGRDVGAEVAGEALCWDDPVSLRAQLAARGLAHLLDLDCWSVLRRDLSNPPRAAVKTTVEAAVCGRQALGATAEEGTRLRSLLRDLLRSEVARRQGWEQAERRWLAVVRPADEPVLRQFDARLRALRRELRGAVGPVDPEDREYVQLHWSREPPAVCAVVRLQRTVPGRREAQPRLALAGWRGGLRLHCTCGEEPACGHRLVLADRLLAGLGSISEEVARALLLLLSDSPWERVLRGLDGLCAGPVAEESPCRLSWRLAGAGTDLELSPRVHWPGKARPSQRLSPGSRGGLDARILRAAEGVDRQVLRVLSAAGSTYLSSPVRQACTVAALELLIGAGHVFLDEKGEEPVEVRRGRLSIGVRVQEGGALLLEPVIDELVVPLTVVRQLAGSSGMALLDRQRRRCLVCEPCPQAAAVAALFERETPVIPPEGIPALLERVPQLERHVAVALPAALEGACCAGAVALVMVLRGAGEGDGLSWALRVRPHPLVDLQVPGQGASELRSVAEGRRIRVSRSLRDESAAAEALVVELGLGSDGFSGEVRGEVALELVAALREQAGRGAVEVVWDGRELRLLRPVRAGDIQVEVERRRDWFGLEGLAEVEGERIELALVLDAVRRGRRFLQVREGCFARLEEQLRQRLARLGEHLQEGRAGLELDVYGALALSELAGAGARVGGSEEWRELQARAARAWATEAALPAGLRAGLRPYQVAGYRWLMRLAAWGVGGCLADDMGLGKTVQALALLLARAPEGPALVVAPTSVCDNWVREAARFAPGLQVQLYRGAGRQRVCQRLAAGQVLVTSYGVALRDVKALADVEFATLVLDEAQALKNAGAQRTRAIRELQAGFRVALSGTPIENRLDELWSLFSVVSPGLLGSLELFRRRYVTPIVRSGDAGRRQALARLLQPFVLRRTKAEVAPELPARTEIALPVALSAGEAELYEEARLAIAARICKLRQARSRADAQRLRFEALAGLTRLRLLACHPQLHDPGSLLGSSKLDRFLALVEELRAGGHRALVFSQFTRSLTLVRQALDEAGVPYLYLDGRTPAAARQQLVDAFQQGSGALFLISLKAGGTGLNLTAASYVVHLDPWWNPAVEDQATDRTHRIGQTQPVTVYRLFAQETVEEGILALQREKRDLVAGVLDETGVAARLGTEELLALLGEAVGASGRGEFGLEAG